jgi:hypothetical protein
MLSQKLALHRFILFFHDSINSIVRISDHYVVERCNDNELENYLKISDRG